MMTLIEDNRDTMELLPCPFCGGEADFETGIADDMDLFYICCQTCGAHSNGTDISHRHEIPGWNTRAIPDQYVQILELVDELDRMHQMTMRDTPSTFYLCKKFDKTMVKLRCLIQTKPGTEVKGELRAEFLLPVYKQLLATMQREQKLREALENGLKAIREALNDKEEA